MNLTAICDVAEFWDNSQIYYRHNGGRQPALQAIDEHHKKAGTKDWHRPAVYVDFRVMLEKADRDVDAVLIATPNHTHAVISIAAMKAGKRRLLRKAPHSFRPYEARRVAQVARETKVATQLGNHGHSSNDIRRAVEWIRDGAIGKVREVHAWRGGPNNPHPAERPQETPPVPKGLDWDLWLGPGRGTAIPSLLCPAHVSILVGFWQRHAGQLRLPHPSTRPSGPSTWNIPR